MSISYEALEDIPDANAAEIAHIHSRLQTQRPAFISEENTLAMIAFGGTIQSAYIPDSETIKSVAMNPGLERVAELTDRFGVGPDVTGAILIAKDSRDITNDDMVMLVHTIREIKNRRIVLTCGTYMLPKIARVLDWHFGQECTEKIIGVTGSSLPMAIESQDADFNIGGAIGAVNAIHSVGKQGIVFVHYHGQIYINAAEKNHLETLELHPPTFKPRFARPFVDVR